MPKRSTKKYSRPRKPFDKSRIEEENQLREKYGLKNKREIWKADASIGRIRNLAKQLITKPEKEKEAFIKRLQEKGFGVNSIAEALSLNKENWLKRRLQTVVFTKGLTTTPKQARQLIAHKHVSVNGRIVNVPSYMVSLEEESTVKLNIVLKIQTPKKSKEEKIKEEIENGEGEEVVENKILEEEVQ
ncbi:30S ribosomal protein S4 [uncultured archaeon]|nr:30S ribosomal protein S4 [uncultured archaeon]